LLTAEKIAAVEPYCPVSAEETETDREEAASLLALSEQTYAHLAASALPSKLTPTGAAKRLPESGTAVGAPRQVKIKLGSEPALSREDALLRGTAFHRALEYLVPEDAAEDAALLAAVERLTAEGKLLPEQQKMLNLPQLAAWLQSDLALRTVACKQVLREYEFAALIPADRILHNGVEDAVLLNGAIDLLMEEDDGLVILDFKTDRVSPDALEARAQHHALQLSLYGMAAEAIFQKPVKETWVWFLRAGKGVRLS
jgi:ATP-dependent helicase/nuclease subunit A